MFYLSIVMGALVGFLTDFWLGRGGFTREPARLVIAVVVAVLVAVFTYTGNLAHF